MGFTIRNLLWLTIAVIAIAGCDHGNDPQKTNAVTAKPPASQPAVTEADVIGLWKGSKYSNPSGEYVVQSVIDEFLASTIEFKPDHTTVANSSDVGVTPGKWSLDGATVVYSLPPVANFPPIVTPLKWEKGTLVEMRGEMPFIYEKQTAPAVGKK